MADIHPNAQPGNAGELHQPSGAGHPQLTTQQGVPVGDDQNSLRAGARGPVLLEDFVLREKIDHFDHERIPERVVHARGSAAHGYFELTDNRLACVAVLSGVEALVNPMPAYAKAN